MVFSEVLPLEGSVGNGTGSVGNGLCSCFFDFVICDLSL